MGCASSSQHLYVAREPAHHTGDDAATSVTIPHSLRTASLSSADSSVTRVPSFVQESEFEGPDSSRRMVFLDVVLLGPNAAQAATTACTFGKFGSKGAPEGSTSTDASPKSLNASTATSVPVVENSLHCASGSASPASDGSSPAFGMRPTMSSRISDVARLHVCHCDVGNASVRIRFWPVERSINPLPTFSESHSSFTAYVVLLPVDSPDREIEFSLLESRVQEVRMAKALRLKSSAYQTPDVAAKNVTQLQGIDLSVGMVPMEVRAQEMNFESDRELSQEWAKTWVGDLPKDLCDLQDLSKGNPTALNDGHSMYTTLVVHTAEWLLC